MKQIKVWQKSARVDYFSSLYTIQDLRTKEYPVKTITIFWYFNFCMPISWSKCQDNSYWSCFICNFSFWRIAYTCIRSFDQINASQILSFPFLHYLSITFSSQHHMFLVFLLNTQNLLSTACVYMNVSTYTRIFVAS